MYVLGTFIVTIGKIIGMIVNVYTFIVIGAVIISWVNPDPYNSIVRLLRQVTEPIFFQVRRLLPRALFRSGLDFTPMIVLLLLFFIDSFFVNILIKYGYQLQQ